MLPGAGLRAGGRALCRTQAIMSNRMTLTWDVPAGEQCGLAGFPGDHEQSGAVAVADSLRQVRTSRSGAEQAGHASRTLG
jgi:hypothetical protein